MRRLLIRNPNLDNAEKTYLTAQYTTGTTLSVVNTFAFANNDFLVVGNPGEEKTEIKKVSSVASDTSFTLASALKFSHAKDTPAIRTAWDQVEISRYRSAAWTVLSTSGLQFDKQDTIYNDSTGASTDSYRFRFYNSSTATYSEYSPTISGAGPNSNQVGYMIERVRKVTGTEGDQETVSDSALIREFNRAQEAVYGVHKDWWFLRFDEDSSITTTASTKKYNLDLMGGGTAGSPVASHTLGFIKSVKYHLNDGTVNRKYQLRYKDEIAFDNLDRDQTRQDNDEVIIYTIRPADTSSKNGYIEVYPTPKNTGYGTFIITGYKKMAVLDDVVDSTPVPLPHIIEDAAIAYVNRIRGKEAEAEYYEELFYGPPEKAQGRRRLTGIALLEQLHKQQEPTGQPKSLIRFSGRRAMRRLYGNPMGSTDRDNQVINYW